MPGSAEAFCQNVLCIALLCIGQSAFLPQYKRHCDLLTPSCALWSVNSDLICTQHSTLHEHYIPHCGIHTACWTAFCEVWTTFWNRINCWRGPFCDNCKVVNLAAVESVSFRFQNIWRGKYCQKFFSVFKLVILSRFQFGMSCFHVDKFV